MAVGPAVAAYSDAKGRAGVVRCMAFITCAQALLFAAYLSLAPRSDSDYTIYFDLDAYVYGQSDAEGRARAPETLGSSWLVPMLSLTLFLFYAAVYTGFSILGGPSVFQTSAAQALFVDVATGHATVEDS